MDTKVATPEAHCASCGSDGDVVLEGAANGGDLATCIRREHLGPRTWQVPPARLDKARFFDRALGRALLLTVLRVGRWAEHGVIEHGFAKDNPAWYAGLVQRHGHTAQAGGHLHQHTASLRIAKTLGALRDQSLVQHRLTAATGRWEFDHTIGAWAPMNVPPSAPILTWAAYATSMGIDPQHWPLAELFA